MRRPLLIITILFIYYCSFSQANYRVFKTQDYNSRITYTFPSYFDNIKEIQKSYKNYKLNGIPAEKNISLIFHNLYNDPSKKIDETKINRQIDLLNQYFESSNYPTGEPSDFDERFIDYYSKENFISFCLTDQSILVELGSSLAPINYRQITKPNFSINNEMKEISNGIPVQHPNSLLNIWIVDLESTNAGFSQYPGGDSRYDGIVIDYKYIKDIDDSVIGYPYDEGKTLVHLVANYLGVNDLWNETNECGDDGIYDTPIHNAPNYDCFNSIHYSLCNGNSEPEMINNYMDATPDN